MDNEKRLYVTRWRWWDMSTMNQAGIGGIMKGVCWPDKSDTPLYMTKHGIRDWRYRCKCTPEQYAKFTEIISGYFDPDEIDFDYKEEEA